MPPKRHYVATQKKAIGRRTGVDILKGKKVRKNSAGFENFDDYFSIGEDKPDTSDSGAPVEFTIEAASHTRKKVITPKAKDDASTTSAEEHSARTAGPRLQPSKTPPKSDVDVLVSDGDPSGSLTRSKVSKEQTGPLFSTRSRTRSKASQNARPGPRQVIPGTDSEEDSKPDDEKDDGELFIPFKVCFSTRPCPVLPVQPPQRRASRSDKKSRPALSSEDDETEKSSEEKGVIMKRSTKRKSPLRSQKTPGKKTQESPRHSSVALEKNMPQKTTPKKPTPLRPSMVKTNSSESEENDQVMSTRTVAAKPTSKLASPKCRRLVFVRDDESEDSENRPPSNKKTDVGRTEEECLLPNGHPTDTGGQHRIHTRSKTRLSQGLEASPLSKACTHQRHRSSSENSDEQATNQAGPAASKVAVKDAVTKNPQSSRPIVPPRKAATKQEAHLGRKEKTKRQKEAVQSANAEETSSDQESPPVNKVRRSKRQRLPVLEYWRNERPIYRRDSTAFTLVDVDHGFEPEDWHIRASKRAPATVPMKKNRPIPGRPHLAFDATEVENLFEDVDGVPMSDILVVDPTTEEEVYIDCVRVKQSYMYYSQGGSRAIDKDPVVICRALQQRAFSTGALILKAGEEKGTHVIKNDTMVFWILTGTMEVTIHETTVILSANDSFFVPQGNKYNIRNIGDVPAELVYFQHKG